MEKNNDSNYRTFGYALNKNVFVNYIEIKARRIKNFLSEKPEFFQEMVPLKINYCFEGRCELILKNGEATYIDSDEFGVDTDSASSDSDAFYYPQGIYKGIEIVIYDDGDMEKGLPFSKKVRNAVEYLLEECRERQAPVVQKADNLIKGCMVNIKNDLTLSQQKEILIMDVCKVLLILSETDYRDISRRIYYSSSQVRIARKTLEILTKNLSKRYSARELAEGFGISETSLKNYFRGVYGKGYSEMLTDIRMQKAAELLIEDENSISQISESVGFSTQSRFGSAFKKYFGETPLEYKRKFMIDTYE